MEWEKYPLEFQANANSFSYYFPHNPLAETAEILLANLTLLNEHSVNPDLLQC